MLFVNFVTIFIFVFGSLHSFSFISNPKNANLINFKAVNNKVNDTTTTHVVVNPIPSNDSHIEPINNTSSIDETSNLVD